MELTQAGMVQGTVGLSGPQKEAVLTTRSDLLTRMRCILDERQALVNSLQVAAAKQKTTLLCLLDTHGQAEGEMTLPRGQHPCL